MKKSYWIILIVGLSFLFVNPASAGMYFGGKIIFNQGSDLEFGYGAGVELGWAFDNLRLEGEFEYRDNDVDDAPGDWSIKMYDLLVNGYYDFFNDSMFTPYVGAGVGYAWYDFSNELEVDIPDLDDAEFVYQFSGGVLLGFEHLKVDVQYRYFADTEDYDTHNFSAGVRFEF